MRGALLIAACVALSLGFAAGRWTAAPPAVYENREIGFRVAAPVFGGEAAAPSRMLVSMHGPAAGAFTANINVLTQTVASMEDFKSATLAQFKQASLTLDKEESLKIQGRDAWRIEYHGKLSNNELHFLALAACEKGKIILATCTATEKQFGELRDAFRASLDSFAFTETAGKGN